MPYCAVSNHVITSPHLISSLTALTSPFFMMRRLSANSTYRGRKQACRAIHLPMLDPPLTHPSPRAHGKHKAIRGREAVHWGLGRLVRGHQDRPFLCRSVQQKSDRSLWTEMRWWLLRWHWEGKELSQCCAMLCHAMLCYAMPWSPPFSPFSPSTPSVSPSLCVLSSSLNEHHLSTNGFIFPLLSYPLQQVLRIESMHYGALSGKGLMLMKLGR